MRQGIPVGGVGEHIQDALLKTHITWYNMVNQTSTNLPLACEFAKMVDTHSPSALHVLLSFVPNVFRQVAWDC